MTKSLAPVDQLKHTLSLPAMKDQFKAALPPHVTVDKFVRVVMTAVSTTPDLVEADRASLLAACLRAAADGLMPDGKEAALTVFKNKQGVKIATYMPMVAGILKKVRNSGELSSITSQIVYEKDDFKYEVTEDGETINHKPNLFGDRGKVLGVYALAKTKDGGVYIEVLTTQQVEAIKKVSRGGDYGPWNGAFAHEMWRKSAIRRLSKRLPMSTDIEHTLHADDDLFNPPDTEPHPPEETQQQPNPTPAKKESKLKQAMKQVTTEDVNIPETVVDLDNTFPSEEELPI